MKGKESVHCVFSSWFPELADCILEKAPRPQLSLGLGCAPQAPHTPLFLGSCCCHEVFAGLCLTLSRKEL